MTLKVIKYFLLMAFAIGVGVIYNYSGEYSGAVAEDFINSNTMQIVNPSNHKTVMNSFSMIVESNKPNDELLARFIKGFYGGPVMFIERSILRMILKNKYQLVGFSKLNNEKKIESSNILFNGSIIQFPVSENVTHIWNANDISSTEELLPNSILYGTFQVSDYGKTDKKSYLDTVFGSDTGNFAGSHRFEIKRLDKERIKVTLYSFVCNPTVDLKPSSQLLNYFHNFYSRLLFCNVLYEIKKP